MAGGFPRRRRSSVLGELGGARSQQLREEEGSRGKRACGRSWETFVLVVSSPRPGSCLPSALEVHLRFLCGPGLRPAAHLSEIGLFRLGGVCCLWRPPERREALVPKEGQPFRTAVWGERGPRTF